MPRTSAPARRHVAHALEPVLAWLEHDRLDPAPVAFADQVEALGLPAPRLQVHEQDAACGGWHRRPRRLALLQGRDRMAERIARERDRHRERDDPRRQREGQVPLRRDDRDDGDDQRGHRHHDRDRSPGALPRERDPGGREEHREQEDLPQHGPGVGHDPHQRDHDHRGDQEDRPDRGRPAQPRGFGRGNAHRREGSRSAASAPTGLLPAITRAGAVPAGTAPRGRATRPWPAAPRPRTTP